MAKILGIDLGTTNSAMAVAEAGQPRIVESAEGNRTTPSVVALSKNGERLVGVLAKRQSVTNPQNTLYSVKRLVGRKFDDLQVQKDKETLTYELRKASNGGVEVRFGENWHTPEEISAMVLGKMKADAESKLGEKIEEAIITVPAYFDDSQRQATKNAGEIAGFKVRRIINEPTAAALAYGLNKKTNEQIVVYDFGGGTFDVSVLEIGDDTIEVRATGGDTHLGGDDFDKALIDHMVDEFKKEQGVDIAQDPLALQRIKESAEKAKHELSVATETEVNLPYITSNDAGPVHFVMKITRAKFESLVDGYITRSLDLIKDTVKEANFQINDIDEVILVGGQTRMPKIQEAVKELFNKEPHKDINPDEVVADGAAIQAGILQGDVKDVLLLDVTPLSLGIETLGGVFTKLIEKNTTIPTSKSQVFSTAADNQTTVEVHVLQGEREMATDNKTLARFMLDGIPPSPRGVPQVEVTLDIDANGILSVSAKDKATDKTQSVRVEASTSLSKEEVEKLKQDAAAHAEEDKKKREGVEVKNNAENLIYLVEKTIRESGDKMNKENKKSLEEKAENIKKLKETDDIDALKTAQEELSQELQKIGAELYQHAQEQGGEADSQEVNQQNDEGSEETQDSSAEPSDGDVKPDDQNAS